MHRYLVYQSLVILFLTIVFQSRPLYARHFKSIWHSELERKRQAEIEQFYQMVLKNQRNVIHPCLVIQQTQIDIAKENMAKHAWARELVHQLRELVDFYIEKDDAYLQEMIPELTPWSPYGTFCPVCGADNTYTLIWDYRQPDQVKCSHCGQVYPDPAFPENGVLDCPRSGQSFTYYIRPGEEKSFNFLRGDSAFVWAGRKVHISFTGVIRHRKIGHIEFIASFAGRLYALTGEIAYAKLAAEILTRLADVYPNYLVHDYWDTYLDAYPIFACDLLSSDTLLTEYEINACPEQAAKSGLKSANLIQTFWGCGRMRCGGVQAEARSLLSFAEAASLIWNVDDNGQPVLTETDKNHLIRNLFVEGLWTFTRWEGVNNKIATCRAGEIGLGRFLGLPEFVHKGVDAFNTFLRGYFEADGASVEGPSYYLYALSNLRDLPELARGYTDPPSYTGKHRFFNLNLYQDNSFYATVLRAGLLMLLPDGHVPTVADAHIRDPFQHHHSWLFEIAAARLGDEYLNYIDTRKGDEFALFNRRPDIAERPMLPLPAHDLFFPDWRVGMLHSGHGGNRVSLVMSFYEPRSHSHLDGLNIALFADGHELLSDLGYIGDNPLDATLRSSHKHLVVMVDDMDQPYRRPAGEVLSLVTSDWVKCLEASQQAYKNVEQYERCCYLVESDTLLPFVIDIFRVKGGQKHDYALHAQGDLLNLSSDDGSLVFKSLMGTIGLDIESLMVAKAGNAGWRATWDCNGLKLRARGISPVDEVIKGEGHGQRTQRDLGERLEFLFARRDNVSDGSVFLTTFEPYRKQPTIRSSQMLPIEKSGDAVAIELKLANRSNVIAVHNPSVQKVATKVCTTNARHTIYSTDATGSFKLFFARGTSFETNYFHFTLDEPELSGEITNSDETGFDFEPSLQIPSGLKGRFIKIGGNGSEPTTAYQIASISQNRIQLAHFPFMGGSKFIIDARVNVSQIEKDKFILRTSTPIKLWFRTHCQQAEFLVNRKPVQKVDVQRESNGLTVDIRGKELLGREIVIQLR